MKKIKSYINTIYRPAFIFLCICLALFSLTLSILAVNLRTDMMEGKSDILYRYPDMLERIVFPLYISIAIIFVIDLNERKNKS